MIIILFLAVCMLMIGIDYKINKRLINVISVFAIPYIVVIPINNWIMVKYGFYLISDRVILMILTGLIMIFAGGIVADYRKRASKTNVIIDYEQSVHKLKFYRMKRMRLYVFLVEFITVARFLIILFQQGISYVSTDAFSGTLLRGILGHLFLTIYPCIPIIFYYWLNHKKEQSYLFLSLIGIALLFLTFVKYHSIGMILFIYFFVSIEDHKYLKKGAAAVVILAAGMFVMNYFISFVIRGTTSLLKENYYLEHLWNYLAGSLIYDNRIFNEGVRIDTNILYKLGSFILTPLNQFTNVMFGVKFCPHQALPFQYVAMNGERGNVVDAIGYLYPSQKGAFDIAIWCLVLVIIGFIFTKIYTAGLKRRDRFATTLCAFMTFFMAFSFFGTFYVNFTCWEILFWCVVMPKIFDKRIVIKAGGVKI